MMSQFYLTSNLNMISVMTKVKVDTSTLDNFEELEILFSGKVATGSKARSVSAIAAILSDGERPSTFTFRSTSPLLSSDGERSSASFSSVKRTSYESDETSEDSSVMKMQPERQ